MNDFMGRCYIHLRDVLGMRGRGVQQAWFKLGPKHDAAHGQVEGMFDGLMGNNSEGIKGEILVSWETKSAPPQ
jgi:hypothetical protein